MTLIETLRTAFLWQALCLSPKEPASVAIPFTHVVYVARMNLDPWCNVKMHVWEYRPGETRPWDARRVDYPRK